MSDPVPAVTEAEATGEIAAIFADIRAVYRVGAVNLIWRHLATIPGALPWAWSALRPLYVSGQIAQAADRFRLEREHLPATPVPADVLTAIGLSRADLTAIRGILAAYDRTNSMALIALTALLHPGPGTGGLTGASPDSGDIAEIPLPALTPLEAMPAALAALVTRLNHFGTSEPQPILASMYRHLSHWPAYLGLAWAVLAPLEASGQLRQTIASALESARTSAARLPITAEPPSPALRAALTQAISPFTGDVLAKMVVICGMLRQITSDPDT